MKLILPKNSSSVSVTVFIQDPDSASGAGLEGLTHNDIHAAYYKSGSAVYDIITLQAATLGEWVSGGFVNVEQGNPNPSGEAYMPGLYQLSLPDAVLQDDSSTLADYSVVVMLTSGTTTIVPCILEIQLNVDVNVTEVDGVPATTGIPDVNVTEVLGTPVVGGTPEVDVIDWNGAAVEASNAGVPRVNIGYIDGVGVATEDKVDANVVEWNNIPLSDHDFIGVEANVINWNSNDEPVFDFEASMSTAVRGTATSATLSSTQMSTNLPSAEDEFYKGRVIIWTSGVLQNVARVITAYVGATKLCTYAITPGAVALVPADGDTFVIV